MRRVPRHAPFPQDIDMLISSNRNALAFALVLGALEIAALPTASAVDEARIPVRDFFRHPERGYFRISPDGKTLAFMQPYERRMNIYVQPLAGGEPRRLTNETARDISDHFWKGPQRLGYPKDFAGHENFHLAPGNPDRPGRK